MTNEEKQLLFKDLCARLPHGVRIAYKENEFDSHTWTLSNLYAPHISKDGSIIDLGSDGWIEYVEYPGAGMKTASRPLHLEKMLPYLRPISSMTEEEIKDFNNLFNGSFQYFNKGIISANRLWDRNEAVFVGELDCSKLIDWLNAHHFDYRGLISMGLALEAPEGMYKNE